MCQTTTASTTARQRMGRHPTKIPMFCKFFSDHLWVFTLYRSPSFAVAACVWGVFTLTLTYLAASRQSHQSISRSSARLLLLLLLRPPSLCGAGPGSPGRGSRWAFSALFCCFVVVVELLIAAVPRCCCRWCHGGGCVVCVCVSIDGGWVGVFKPPSGSGRASTCTKTTKR